MSGDRPDGTVRVLILGGAGMLGHRMWRTFRDRFETFVTLRSLEHWRSLGLFDPARMVGRILGMGDILGLIEKAEEVVDFTPEDNIAERVARRFGAALGTQIVGAWRGAGVR